MAYLKTTIESLMAKLSAKILPFFQQEKLAVEDQGDHNTSDIIRLVELPRPTTYDLLARTPRVLKYLNSPELNIHKEYLGNESFSTALKRAGHYIDECVEIPVSRLNYYRINKVLTRGLFSKKVYAAISSRQAITITHNGKTFPVASLDTRIYLPESVCRELASKYTGKYPDHATIKLSVKGPATLYGGYDEGSFMRFYCLEYFLEIYAESYKAEVVV